MEDQEKVQSAQMVQDAGVYYQMLLAYLDRLNSLNEGNHRCTQEINAVLKKINVMFGLKIQ